MSKMLTGVLIGGLLISVGGAAFAVDANTGSTKDPVAVSKSARDFGWKMKHKRGFKGKGPQGFVKNLDQLVKDGVITQDKAKEIKAFVDKKAKEMEAQRQEFKKMSPEERKKAIEQKKAQKPGQKRELVSDLVANKILTQDQANTIKTKMQEQNQKRITDGLKSLVDKKTITQDQSDKILKALQDAQKNRQSLFEKTKNMTPEERRQYMKDNKASFINPLKQLVDNGTVNKDRAKEIGKVIFHHGR